MLAFPMGADADVPLVAFPAPLAARRQLAAVVAVAITAFVIAAVVAVAVVSALHTIVERTSPLLAVTVTVVAVLAMQRRCLLVTILL